MKGVKGEKGAERIGIFGGSFDPVHNAHCAIAEASIREAGLDRVIFVVAARPPHKASGTEADAEDRYDMVCAAVKDLPQTEVSRIELDRAGPSYTVDTLRAFQERYPSDRLFLILGFDSLLDLPRWKDYREILAGARPLVVPRLGLDQTVPAELEGQYDLLPFRATDLSSTELRERIISGLPFADLVPAAVAQLIREKGIYDADHA